MNSLFKIPTLCVLFYIFSTLCWAGGSQKIDFSTPRNTINTYFENYSDRNILSSCFNPPSYEGSLDRWWLEYTIEEEIKSDKVGTKTYSGIFINKDAVEIVVEVKLNHPKKNNPKTKFWFLLQKSEKDWKILDHSHLPDKNYPAYD